MNSVTKVEETIIQKANLALAFSFLCFKKLFVRAPGLEPGTSRV